MHLYNLSLIFHTLLSKKIIILELLTTECLENELFAYFEINCVLTKSLKMIHLRVIKELFLIYFEICSPNPNL